ncbi:unnamed protein product [Colias eurytheme]|nr:unnamed protein product [Colias eurytheme]
MDLILAARLFSGVLGQSSPPPSEEPSSGIKPINYAAAAKANKPKTTPPLTEKPQPQPAVKTEKPKEKKEKVAVKTKVEKPTAKLEKPTAKLEKPVQRKNSTK